MPIYQLDHIIHSYKNRPVLLIDQWSVEKGMITGLCGPNGSGKSTLLKLLAFIESPSQGNLYFNGHKADPYAKGLRDRVALLPQESYLLKRNVYQNVAYGLHIRKDKVNETDRVHQALSLVGLAADQFSQRPWFALSGGEARRVALAARLVLRPKVLLLDEPTTSVDAASAQLIKEAALQAHHQWGTSLIISSHDRRWLQDTCHDVIFLFNGCILGRGERTLLFGPWQRLDTNRVSSPLTTDQMFIAENAPAAVDTAVAAIDTAGLTLHRTGKSIPEGRIALKGLLKSLGLEKISGKISLSVAVGNTEFNAYIDKETLSREGYQPGGSIWIAYQPKDVQWY
jgi:tungstate transport system ATP-binding protein